MTLIKYTKTAHRIKIGNRYAIIYQGKRGGKYIRKNGDYVLLSKMQKGGSPKSIVMNLEGDYEPIDELFEGNKPFFRKYFHKPGTSEREKEFYRGSLVEREVYKRLKNHPQKNTVNVYNITDDYVDIELLDTYVEDKEKAFVAAKKAKTQLQKLHIMYIDWKFDNMGIAEDGTYKLFDFDVSGIVDENNPNVWKMKPLEYYSYKNVTKNAKDLTPIEIDNKAFELLK